MSKSIQELAMKPMSMKVYLMLKILCGTRKMKTRDASAVGSMCVHAILEKRGLTEQQTKYLEWMLWHYDRYDSLQRALGFRSSMVFRPGIDEP